MNVSSTAVESAGEGLHIVELQRMTIKQLQELRQGEGLASHSAA